MTMMCERTRDLIILFLLCTLITAAAIVQRNDTPPLWRVTVTERCAEDEVITPIEFPTLFECTHIDDYARQLHDDGTLARVDGIGRR